MNNNLMKLLEEERTILWLATIQALQSPSVKKRRLSNLLQNEGERPRLLSPATMINWQPIRELCNHISGLLSTLMYNFQKDDIDKLKAKMAELDRKVQELNFLRAQIQATELHATEPAHKKKKKKIRTGVICQSCGTTESPEWRRGPNHLLYCNACGLRYKKELKKKDRNQCTYYGRQ